MRKKYRERGEREREGKKKMDLGTLARSKKLTVRI